jgi:hypothetical protein
MYNDDMTIGSWAAIRGRCTARHLVNDGDTVEFSFRSGSQTLELAFDAATLEDFVQLGSAALEEMKERRAGGPVG